MLVLAVVASAGLDAPKLKVGALDVLLVLLGPGFVNKDFVLEVLFVFEKRLELGVTEVEDWPKRPPDAGCDPPAAPVPKRVFEGVDEVV